MAENSKIEWCDHTFNPWVGCTKISPACDNCYAESWAKRAGSPELWSGERRRTTPANWQKPLAWNRKAASEGRRYRVFCASLADVFDNEVPDEWREDLWDLVLRTPNLDWLLLTKRIGNARHMLPDDWHDGYPNVWIGATVVNQAEADRDVPKLLKIPAVVRFLSCEPLLGPIDLRTLPSASGIGRHLDALSNAGVDRGALFPHALDWVIVGGESGHNARPLNILCCKFLRKQCEDSDTAFFMKQGSQANWPSFKDFSSFPPSLHVREFPR